MPDGDIKKHREDFFVNENLKRLGCSGRVGISLSKPTGATQAKFYQLYRTSEKIDLYKAVIELVKLCQVALTLFDQLGPEYADGLLCDVTERAINDWWTEIGTDLYNVEPQDGVLGPTTVAAILGTLIGARNRLSAFGAQTSKDVFDVEATKRAIAYFQKSQRLPKTRRLDRTTLKRLHSATAKAATNEGWTVPRVMKSTVAELGGKGGEMVMEMVGAKEKAGIADVETVDIEQFVQLVRGERAKWLWYGKPRKSNTGDMFNRLPAGFEGGNMEFRPDEHGGYAWQGTRKDSSVYEPPTPGGFRSSMETSRRSNDLGDDDRAHFHKLTKRHSNKEEGRRGIGKIRNAVSLRSHHHKHDSIEDANITPLYRDGYSGSRITRASKHEPSSSTSAQENDGVTLSRIPTVTEEASVQDVPAFTKVLTETPMETSGDPFSPIEAPTRLKDDSRRPPGLDEPFGYDAPSPARTPEAGSSIAGSTYHGVDLDELFSVDDEGEQVGRFLRRSRSAEAFEDSLEVRRDPGWWPRNLSFSVAEDSILTWDTGNWDMPKDLPEGSPEDQHAKQQLIANDSKRAREILAHADLVSNWVGQSIEHIKSLEDLCEADIQELDSMYYPRLEAYQRLRIESQEALAGEKARLAEVLKDVEVLGAKLEYEINALRSKVEDVEDGVDEFARQVASVETMVGDLEERYKPSAGHGRGGWIGRAFDTIAAFGTKFSMPASTTTQEER